MKIIFWCLLTLCLVHEGELMAQTKLKQYRERRHLKRSGEPRGGKAKKTKQPIFVIQKHDASHLHYDFRLEIGGVLASWAIPKGPSMDPKIKRLAVRTDDHPMEYADFEGVIPEGEYGAGSVMVWDTGSYKNIKKSNGKLVPMSSCLKDGHIEVELNGKKLHGAFALVRTHFSGKEQWLCVKMRDDYASARANPVSTQNKSALTGRTTREIAQEEKKSFLAAPGYVKVSAKDDPPVKRGKESSRVIKVGNRIINLSNEDKILFPKSKITKGDLISYYHDIAPTVVPYIKERLITMQRFPEGIGKDGFFQKDAGKYFPEWIKTKRVKKQEGGAVDYVICNNAATLVYLANQAVITPHIWLSKADALDYPDRLIFDLDPSTKDFELVRTAALELKDFLEDLGLKSFVMTTGSRGLHVVIPLKRKDDFDTVRDFARDLATYMAENDPDHLTVEVRKEKRHGRVFIDYLRNAFGQTGVAPYAVRPIEGAPVATPLHWHEVEDPHLTPQKYTINNVLEKLKKDGDPWKGINKSARSIRDARKQLDRLMHAQ